MNTILNGMIGLLGDAVNVADYRLPARRTRRVPPARKTGALLFLTAVAVIPLLMMAWWLW